MCLIFTEQLEWIRMMQGSSGSCSALKRNTDKDAKKWLQIELKIAMKIKRWIYSMIIVYTSAEIVLQVDACLICHKSCSQNTPTGWQLTTTEEKPLIRFHLCWHLWCFTKIIMIITKIYSRKFHKTYTNRMVFFLCTGSTNVLWDISFQGRIQAGHEGCTGLALCFAQEWAP